MTRKILCLSCGTLKPMHPEDVLMGWHRRRVEIVSRMSVACDTCGSPCHDGAKCMCETMWRGEDEPEYWEAQYGDINYFKLVVGIVRDQAHGLSSEGN